MNSSILINPTFGSEQIVKSTRVFLQRYALFLLLVMTVSFVAQANSTGTGGQDFDTVYQLLVGWSTGTLGKIFAVGAFIVGMGIGIVKQSLLAIAIGLGIALTMNYGPAIIDSLFTFAV